MKQSLILVLAFIFVLFKSGFVNAQCIDYYVIDSIPDEGSNRYHIKAAGDVNNDGYDDFLISNTSSNYQTNVWGSVYVHSGKTGLILYTVEGDPAKIGSNFGRNIGGVGDINGDGYDDFVANGSSSYGSQLYSGLDGSILMDNLPYCYAIDAAGDVNNDGVNDILLGDYLATCDYAGGTRQGGKVTVVSGVDGSYLHELTGTCSALEHFGRAVAGMGDLNDDGHDDFAIGIPQRDVYLNGTFIEHGEVLIISGADGDTLQKIHAGMDFYDNYNFGYDLDNIGDVNNDGYNDIIIGHADAGNSLSRHDSCWVFSGKYDPIIEIDTITNDTTVYLTDSLLFTLRNNTSNLRFGMSVSAAGDVNLDGTPDMAVADSTHQYNRIHIYSGVDGSMLQTIRGPQSTYTGDRLEYAGDINGDGKGDLLSGWQKYLPYDPDTIIFHVFTCIFEDPACEADTDTDGDGYGDLCDNCPSVSNLSQLDSDHDGIGDACDDCYDPDWDELCADVDNCPEHPNPGQEDSDGDGVGDPCDGCPDIYNPNQTDRDGDGHLDSCDVCPDYASNSQIDSDGDGLGDLCDNCQYVANADQLNTDGDRYGDVCDNCPDLNHNQIQDWDNDGLGDPCDECTDRDEDGFGQGWPYETCTPDNCTEVYNPNQSDVDGDGYGDGCDNCPEVFNEYQEDWNYDGFGDSCVTTVAAPTGSDVVVDLGSGVTLTIGDVQYETTAEIHITEGDDPPAADAFAILPGGPVVYHIDIPWGTNPPYTICINYDDSGLNAEDEAKVALWHSEEIWNSQTYVYDTVWVNISTTLDTVNNIVCGETQSLSPFTVGIDGIITDVGYQVGTGLPDEFGLSQNYPNPFNPQTMVEYSIAKKSRVLIEVFNISGQKVRTLVDKTIAAGIYRITWDGTDSNGEKVSSGIYLYRIKADDYVATRKMILLK